jgi:hypothetical protein
MANEWKRLILVLTITLSGIAYAAPSRASVSGHVKNSSGQPQMGAVIEVFTTAATDPIKAFTDA